MLPQHNNNNNNNNADDYNSNNDAGDANSWLMMNNNNTMNGLGLLLFFAILVVTILPHGNTLFWDVHGWRHRLLGGVLLIWLILGTCWILLIMAGPATAATSRQSLLLYDVLLGCLGIATTLSAARDFPHKRKYHNHHQQPQQSGTLSKDAMVSQDEMLEHSFYQGLNLWQALYLHLLSAQHLVVLEDWRWRGGALFLVTCPWWIRHWFPVHSFSQNWKQQRQQQPTNRRSSDSSKIEEFLYKLKKMQYMFYKHVIFHSVNITMFLQPSQDLVAKPAWRLFWLALNASYVMEFFLQSLVKRRVLSQTNMLRLNQLLMAVASCAAISAFATCIRIRWDVALISVTLNILHRYHDVFNTVALAGVMAAVAASGYGSTVLHTDDDKL